MTTVTYDDDAIPQAVTINYFYDVISDIHSLRVTYTMPGDTKKWNEYKFASHLLETAHNPADMVAVAFVTCWIKSGLPDSAVAYLTKTLDEAGKKKYASSQNWNTHFGGSHGPAFVSSVGSLVGELVSIEPAHVGINGKNINNLARNLPGVATRVEFPCDCCKDDVDLDGTPFKESLFSMIIHLNDNTTWTREQIADWIDKLHDDGKINAEFAPWDETGMAEEEADIKEPIPLPEVFETKDVWHNKYEVELNASDKYHLNPDGTITVTLKGEDFDTLSEYKALSFGPYQNHIEHGSPGMQGHNNITSIMDEVSDYQEDIQGVKNDDTN